MASGGVSDHFSMNPNVAWFNMVLRELNSTERRRGDRAGTWNIPRIDIFAKRVPHVVCGVFHLFIESPISLIIFLLTPCSSIDLHIHECGTESWALFFFFHTSIKLVLLFLLSEHTVLSINNCFLVHRLTGFTPFLF